MHGRLRLVVGLAAVALLLLRGSGNATPDVARLAAELRELYASRSEPWERWRREPRRVRLGDGRELPREQAFRDQALFAAAAASFLESQQGDEAALGAWLLGTTPPARASQAESYLVAALRHPDRRAAFEAARALANLGRPSSLPALQQAAREAPAVEVRSASARAAETIASRQESPRGPAARDRSPLSPAFRRGVNWWVSESKDDDGAASFRTLSALGVDWVSIHTWDPLQRDVDDPELAPLPHSFRLRRLDAIVANAHAAGLRVMLKPHLEMRIERGAARPKGWHNEIEMKSERDWQRWFANYERYLLGYAEQAREAGADMFCVGRELDRSVVLREADWRRLIIRVRSVFAGPLVYSANFDTFAGIGLWDALDYIGLSAYFPLSTAAEPTAEQLEAGWGRILGALEATSRRFERPLLLTEIGYPAVPSAALEPWRETRAPADAWMQARCYDAALRSFARHPWIAGTFWWLWEGTAQPPFRDPSFSIQGKPAAFVMAAWYRGD